MGSWMDGVTCMNLIKEIWGPSLKAVRKSRNLLGEIGTERLAIKKSGISLAYVGYAMDE